MEPRGKGRARGRARTGGQPAGGQAQQPRPGPPQGAWSARPSGVPLQQGVHPGAWAGRSQPAQQSQQPQQWAARPAAPEALQTQTVGRGSRQGGGDDRSLTGETRQISQGGDSGLGQERRGGGNGVRGRTNRNEIISTRPAHIKSKKGTDGTPIRLRANYFPLVPKGLWGLNQYRVDFAPDLDNTSTRKYLVRTGLQNKNVSGYLFDGTVLYTPNRIHPDPLSFVVDTDDGTHINVTLRLVGEVKWGDYHYLQLFNIIMRKCLTFMDLKLMGRNYFDPKLKISIPEHNLELWPGYFTSIRQYERSIMINADLSFKVLRTDNVYDLLLECGQSRNPHNEFRQRVIGNIVLTYYNNKTYRIDDVDFKQTPASTFQKRDGSSISYAQYFQERYRVPIDVMEQPMLVSRSKQREIKAGMPETVVLIPSLCIMTGLTDKQRENFHLMKALGEHTRVGPQGRIQKIREFSQRLQNCREAMEEIRRWDLEMARDLVEVSGRVLPEETLILRNGTQITGGPEADFTKSLRTAPMFNVAPIDKLAVLCPGRFRQGTNEFVSCLIKVGKGMHFNLGSPKIIDMQDDRAQSYLDNLDYVITNLAPKMVLVILPNNSADRYNAVKKKCYVDRAMPCQVIVGKTLSNKGLMSVATKVAIQMNCKMGGAPWGTALPKATMIVGYDVCRDTANRGKSFAGMVASMDNACSQYFSLTTEHEQEQELSSNISTFLLLACKTYQERNKIIPERIVIYRDGVGDGQIQYVKEHEVDIIKKKLEVEVYKSQPIKMAFIIVSKRINTKIFRFQGAGPKNDFNPPPGTVVDDVITWPERYDFYIVSQCVRQGTVAPTSYNVIEDSLGIDANRLQKFTFKLCHMYYNYSGTVRVPAPCQYAHKLAFLTAQSLHRAANPALNNTLYYL
ncbi:piwi-like protein Siwi isoform X2 [Cylas formicarius]|nr:piwi-like protein Siwi isoform X2 [Cylas formicarius]